MRRGQGREQVTASHGPARALQKWLRWGRPGEARVAHVHTVVAPKGSCSPSCCTCGAGRELPAPRRMLSLLLAPQDEEQAVVL